ncbi:MAG: hypothetical protein GC154_14115 [bacterium]|nr:hypothetical protein [bacterium]
MTTVLTRLFGFGDRDEHSTATVDNAFNIIDKAKRDNVLYEVTPPGPWPEPPEKNGGYSSSENKPIPHKK